MPHIKRNLSQHNTNEPYFKYAIYSHDGTLIAFFHQKADAQFYLAMKSHDDSLFLVEKGAIFVDQTAIIAQDYLDHEAFNWDNHGTNTEQTKGRG